MQLHKFKFVLFFILFMLSLGFVKAQFGISGEGVVYYKNPIKEDSAKNAALLLAQRNALINAGVLHSSSTFSQMEEIRKIERKSKNRCGTFEDIYKSISYSDVQGLVKTNSIDYEKSEVGGYYSIKANGRFDVEKTNFNGNYNELLRKNQIKIPISIIFTIESNNLEQRPSATTQVYDKDRRKWTDEYVYNEDAINKEGVIIPEWTLEELNKWIIDDLNKSSYPVEVFVKQPYKKLLGYSNEPNYKEIFKIDKKGIYIIYISFERTYYKPELGQTFTRIGIKLLKNGYKKELISTYFDQYYYIKEDKAYFDNYKDNTPFDNRFYEIFSELITNTIFELGVASILSK